MLMHIYHPCVNDHITRFTRVTQPLEKYRTVLDMHSCFKVMVLDYSYNPYVLCDIWGS